MSHKRMTEAHKAALAVGREEGRVVRRYLEALEAGRARAGRRRSADVVQRHLDDTAAAIPQASALERVHLLQRRLDLEEELEDTRRHSTPELAELEAAFIEALPGYSRRKHLSYAAWREAGVPARVLKAAGIRRSTT